MISLWNESQLSLHLVIVEVVECLPSGLVRTNIVGIYPGDCQTWRKYDRSRLGFGKQSSVQSNMVGHAAVALSGESTRARVWQWSQSDIPSSTSTFLPNDGSASAVFCKDSSGVGCVVMELWQWRWLIQYDNWLTFLLNDLWCR